MGRPHADEQKRDGDEDERPAPPRQATEITSPTRQEAPAGCRHNGGDQVPR
jgi:hypothetical protein